MESKFQVCETDQRFPKGPDVDRDFSGSRSQVVQSCWVHLWCSPSGVCSQSAGRLHKEGAADGCVFSGSRHHQSALCVFCRGRVRLRFFFFLLASFCTFCFSGSRFTFIWFLGRTFFLFVNQRVAACFIPTATFFRHRRTSLLWFCFSGET